MAHSLMVLYGRDRRGTDPRARDKWISQFIGPWNTAGVFSSVPVAGTRWYGGSTYTSAPYLVPWAVSSAPFAADDNGQPFPTGTLWVYLPQDQVIPAAGSPVSMVFRAAGIPNGSVGSGTIKNGSGTTLQTFTVPWNGSSALVVVSPFTQPAGGFTVSVTWTAGAAHSTGYTIGSPSSINSSFVAVPSTLPAGFTFNPDLLVDRGGTFGMQYQNRKRLRAGPNTTYANMGLSAGLPTSGGEWRDDAFGCGVGGLGFSNLWWQGKLWKYYVASPGVAPFFTAAQGTSCPSVAGGTFVAGVGPVGGSSTTIPGARAGQLVVTFSGSTPTASESVGITVTQDGTTIYTATETGSAISGMAGTFSLPLTLNAAGTTTTIAVVLTGSTSGTPGRWFLSTNVTVSPRCDLPLPYTVVGAGIAAPGGIMVGQLGTPNNAQPLTRLAAGVTSYSSSSAYNVAFLPTADGWYQVLVSSSAIGGIGMDPFGWLDPATAAPGLAGCPFYAAVPAGGTATLTPWSPPAPTAAATGGTTINFTQKKYAWVSVALPSKGSWRVDFACHNGMGQAGMQVRSSLTDPTVLENVSAWTTWEPILELAPSLAAPDPAMQNTPPSSPLNGSAYVVGSSPTGAWTGYAGYIAYWDSVQGAWVFAAPETNSYIHDDCWYDGNAWHTNGTDPQISLRFTTTAAQTVYLLVQLFDTMNTPSTPQVIVSWSAA